MDGNRFDTLAETLARAGTRRDLLGRLLTVPLLAAFAALLSEASVAKDRRRRTKGRHNDHQKRKDRHRDKSRKKKDEERQRKKRRLRKPCPECQRRDRKTGQCVLANNTPCGAGVCCGGACQARQCCDNDGCPSAQVCISNGSCATPCIADTDCQPACALCEPEQGSSRSFCTSGGIVDCNGCSGSTACTQNAFCRPTTCAPDPSGNACIPVCNP